MPRNMSFARTTPQFRARTKTVTRKCGNSVAPNVVRALVAANAPGAVPETLRAGAA